MVVHRHEHLVLVRGKPGDDFAGVDERKPFERIATPVLGVDSEGDDLVGAVAREIKFRQATDVARTEDH